MAEPAVARETLFALRETISRIEGKAILRAADGVGQTPKDGFRPRQKPGAGPCAKTLPLGLPAFDDLFGGGLPLDALMELRGGALRDAGAVTGFALGLCVLLHGMGVADGPKRPVFLWIGERMAAMDAGLPNAEGLQDFGLPPGNLIYAVPKDIGEALWLAEAALGSGAFAAVLLEVRGNPGRFGLTESRRLSLKARAAGRPIFLLRQAGEEEASSAVFRLHVRPAPATSRPLPDGSRLVGSIGNPVFHLTVEKSRVPALSDIYIEWSAHDRLFSPVIPALKVQRPAHPGAALSTSADRQDRAQPLGDVVAFSRAS